MSRSKPEVPISETLYRIMEEKHISVQTLSEKAKVSRMQIYNILNYDPKGIHLGTLVRLCKALEIDPNTLLQYQEK